MNAAVLKLPVADAPAPYLSGLPRLNGKACQHSLTRAYDQQLRPSAETRRAWRNWLHLAHSAGRVTAGAISGALQSETVNNALAALVDNSTGLLARELSDITRALAPGYGSDWHGAPYTLELSEDRLWLHNGGYIYCGVDSLNRVPEDIARVAYTALTLVEIAFAPAILPHWVLDEDFDFGWMEVHDEYLSMVQEGVVDDPVRAAQYAEQQGFMWFTFGADEIAREIEYHRSLIAPAPKWVHVTGRHDKPVSMARRLIARIDAWSASAPEKRGHAWTLFALEVASWVIAAHRSDARFQRCKRQWCSGEDLDFEEVPIEWGIWVDSGSPLEERLMQDRYEGMSNAGESPSASLPYRDGVQNIIPQLQQYAMGVGFYARADAVNDLVNGELM